MMQEKLAYTGKIVEIGQILGADFIEAATVVCGSGGRWKGIVKKGDFQLGDLCTVFLPDAIVPQLDELKFMEKSHWRVKMQRFKGSPSEVLIVPLMKKEAVIGEDCTSYLGVTKYEKPVPANLQGKVIGEFPGFIPKTDEVNYQAAPDLIEALHGLPFYITEKCDGSSTTAYKYKGKFGVCSRNWELAEEKNNGYWEIARRYELEKNLPEGLAIQWETCGPKIQKNPMGLPKVEGFGFSAYDIAKKQYLGAYEMCHLFGEMDFPTARIIVWKTAFNKSDDFVSYSNITYSNGKPAEGCVIRSQMNRENGKPISFKVINLSYEK